MLAATTLMLRSTAVLSTSWGHDSGMLVFRIIAQKVQEPARAVAAAASVYEMAVAPLYAPLHFH